MPSDVAVSAQSVSNAPVRAAGHAIVIKCTLAFAQTASRRKSRRFGENVVSMTARRTKWLICTDWMQLFSTDGRFTFVVDFHIACEFSKTINRYVYFPNSNTVRIIISVKKCSPRIISSDLNFQLYIIQILLVDGATACMHGKTVVNDNCSIVIGQRDHSNSNSLWCLFIFFMELSHQQSVYRVMSSSQQQLRQIENQYSRRMLWLSRCIFR